VAWAFLCRPMGIVHSELIQLPTSLSLAEVAGTRVGGGGVSVVWSVVGVVKKMRYEVSYFRQ
jgi:hypothetical protein